jgi:hypothetical protein
MRAVSVITTAMVALTGCFGTGAEEESEGARNSGFFFVRRDERACVAEGVQGVCERYTVAPANGGLARCADGRVSSSCAVGNLDLAGVGLTDAQALTLRAAISPSLVSPSVVLRGQIAADGFFASDAWRAPTSHPVLGTVVEVMGAGETLIQHRVNTSTEPTYVSAVDVSGLGDMTAAARAMALTAASSEEGLIVAGTTGYDAVGRRVVRAEQVFVRAESFNGL